MQHLNTLWQVVSAASTVREWAQQVKTYTFVVNPHVTFYLRAENADVCLTRWQRPMIEVTLRLQVPMGWRVETDQDDAGVYMVARRRAVVGGLSSAAFEVVVPHDAYLVLKLQDGQVRLTQIDGTVQIAPPDADQTTRIQQR